MSTFSKSIVVAFIVMLTAVPAFSARRVLGPHVVVVRPYGYFGGAWFGPRAYWGPYYYYPPYWVSRSTGEVKIDTHLKDAELYVDGGYVGPVGKFKKFELLPGNHDIEIRDSANSTLFHQQVQVLIGKTTEIRPPA